MESHAKDINCKMKKIQGQSIKQIAITFLDTLKGRFVGFRINTEQLCNEDLTSHQT